MPISENFSPELSPTVKYTYGLFTLNPKPVFVSTIWLSSLLIPGGSMGRHRPQRADYILLLRLWNKLRCLLDSFGSRNWRPLICRNSRVSYLPSCAKRSGESSLETYTLTHRGRVKLCLGSRCYSNCLFQFLMKITWEPNTNTQTKTPKPTNSCPGHIPRGLNRLNREFRGLKKEAHIHGC